jgi:hypothetical protein
VTRKTVESRPVSETQNLDYVCRIFPAEVSGRGFDSPHLHQQSRGKTGRHLGVGQSLCFSIPGDPPVLTLLWPAVPMYLDTQSGFRKSTLESSSRKDDLPHNRNNDQQATAGSEAPIAPIDDERRYRSPPLATNPEKQVLMY